MSYDKVIDPFERSAGINFFRTDSYFSYKNKEKVSKLIKATYDLLMAKPYKVLALDLDNTLWDGILREDGIKNITVGGTSSLGKFFYVLQNILLYLRSRGILLVIISKNRIDDVIKAFKFLECPLKIDDFVLISAEDKPKSLSIKRASKELNISLGDFMFLDDTEYERNEVGENIPEVSVAPLTSDRYRWLKILQDHTRFKKTLLNASQSVESNRTKVYQQRFRRLETKPTINESKAHQEWLRSLNQSIIAQHTSAPSSRALELFQRVNQFNSVGRKLSKADIERLLENNYELIEYSVSDRHGSDGIVAVTLVRQESNQLIIHDFLLSCRVFGRNIEKSIIYYLMKYQKANNCSELKAVHSKLSTNAASSAFLSRIINKNGVVNQEKVDLHDCIEIKSKNNH